MSLGARERPISRKNLIVKVIQGEKPANSGFQRDCRKASLLKITSDLGFASRTKSQVPYGQLQRCFHAGRALGFSFRFNCRRRTRLAYLLFAFSFLSAVAPAVQSPLVE